MAHKRKAEGDKPDISRRKFGQSAALAGMAAVLASSPVSARQNASSPSTPSQVQDKEEKPAEKNKEIEEVEARYQRAMQVYGDRLSVEQQARIRKILTYNERLLEPIRNFPLKNGDATATGFKLYPDASPGKLSKPHKEQS